MLREIGDRIVEPVTVAEAKDHLGYSPADLTYDDSIKRNITAMRMMLEGALDMFIGYRGVELSDLPEGRVELPYRLERVEKCAYTDAEGIPQDMPYKIYGTPKRTYLEYELPEGGTDPRIICRVGFADCPEEIRSAICDLVKAKYDRAPVDPVLEDCRATLRHYWRYNL